MRQQGYPQKLCITLPTDTDDFFATSKQIREAGFLILGLR